MSKSNIRVLERVLSRLPLAKPTGRSQRDWVSPCPAHKDTRPSLSIGVGADGRALVHCHAGCTPEAIMSTLSLTMADLMPPVSLPAPEPNVCKDQAPYVPLRPPHIYASAAEAIDALKPERGECSAFWTYTNAAYEPVGIILRWDPRGGKVILPVSRIDGGWIIGGMPEPRPLYRLPDLLSRPDERVYVTEGEKAAEAARTLGVLATTSPHGSNSASKADWTPLAGRDVVILPDNDRAGHKYAIEVVAILRLLEPPATVRIVELPDLPPKGDIVEWLDSRDSVETAALREQLEKLVEESSQLTVGSCQQGHSPLTGNCELTTVNSDEPVLVCLADVPAMPIRWLWPGRMALGRITVLVGRPGEGKSFLTTDMAARVTTGSAWPDGSTGVSGSAILICAEDDPSDTIRPRLDALGADTRRVHLLSMVRHTTSDGRRCESMFSLADLPALEQALRAHRDCKLVVVDPIGSFLGAGADSHRDTDVRAVLAPVAKLAELYGPAVLVVAHRRKSAGAMADDLTMGSRAFTGIARAVWHLTRDSQNKSRRLLLPGKNNLAAEGTGLAFSIGGTPAVLSWENNPVALTADEAVRQESGEHAGADSPQRRQAMMWLKKRLADGPVRLDEIKIEAQATGLSRRTLFRARDELDLHSYRDGNTGRWMWALCEADEDLLLADV